MNVKLIFSVVLIILIVITVSCSHYNELQTNANESSLQGKSHNAGKNCSSCHNNVNSGASDKWWTMAGTVYRSNGSMQSNATIELWEKPGKKGRLIKSLVTDQNGNFYTNQIIDFNTGCYPSVTTASNSKSMDTTTFTGNSCNSCHGISRGKIIID